MTIATRDEMFADGWVSATIGGIACLQYNGDGYTFVSQDNETGYMSQEAIETIIAELGEPYKVHRLSDGITSIEY